MLSHDLKCIYLHPPKTGGKSIEQAIFGVEPSLRSADHRKLKHYVDEEGRGVLDYFKFIFVRNPWDRAVSQYFGQAQIIAASRGSTATARTFREAVLNPRWLHEMKRQIDWVRLDGETLVDFVGRVEKMQEGFDEVCDRLDLPRQQVPHLNASSHEPYWTYYDDETRELVAERYKKDIETFGYRFGL